MIEARKRYLVQTKNGQLREWGIHEVSEHAIKVENLVKGPLSLFSSDGPSWILKSDIDQLGNTEYRILEDLGPMK